MKKSGNNAGVIFVLAVVVLAAIFGGLFLSRNVGKSTKTVSRESSLKKLEKMVERIEPLEGNPTKGTVEYADDDATFQELPTLTDDSIVVEATTGDYAEIFASSKAF